jgi:hypothetical protein
MSQADDEEWRPQYDAIENLRILNKFHGEELDLSTYADFVTQQIENLRSSNSRNALNLVYEIYSRSNVTGD